MWRKGEPRASGRARPTTKVGPKHRAVTSPPTSRRLRPREPVRSVLRSWARCGDTPSQRRPRKAAQIPFRPRRREEIRKPSPAPVSNRDAIARPVARAAAGFRWKTSFSSRASSKNRARIKFCVARHWITTGHGWTPGFRLWCLSPCRILCSNLCLGGAAHPFHTCTEPGASSAREAARKPEPARAPFGASSTTRPNQTDVPSEGLGTRGCSRR
jgi:hypothetical protein